MQLSIIIVNYNAGSLIVDCINSALQFPSTKNCEWIVVDNNSSDNSKALLAEKFTFIKWIDMKYNAGFARANNVGIQRASGDIILLLNPDTIVLNDCINICFERFINNKAIACSVSINKSGWLSSDNRKLLHERRI